jgi:3-oxoacyl-[acyl-carrier-protein] synthase-1
MAVSLTDVGIVCALGDNKSQVLKALLNTDFSATATPLTVRKDLLSNKEPLYVGQVNSALPPVSSLPVEFQTRNNQLAWAAFAQIKDTFATAAANIEPSRIAVIIGTSTSGILEGEQAIASLQQKNSWPPNFQYSMQEMGAPATFLAHLCGATGPTYAISTACTSSAKALASANFLIESGVADLVLCGGVDTLSQLPSNGFKSLESTSEDICAPFAKDRDGINLGEAAALFIMTKENPGIQLMGIGESSDAYHISSPHPEGDGAEVAMRQALTHSGLSAHQLDYINLHGTGTPKNDEMESAAVFRVCADTVACSSTKHLTGHTLGAAGALEAGFCWLLLSQYNTQQSLPLNNQRRPLDTNLASINLCSSPRNVNIQYCMSNSFAFGGNNVSLVLGV